MKILSLITVFLLGIIWPGHAQGDGYELPVTSTLTISDLHTTSLVFSYPIVNVDRGSQDILAQRPKGVENVLQIKAAQQEFVESNLTVVTTDGKLYNFLIVYEQEPLAFAYDFRNQNKKDEATLTEGRNYWHLDALASMAYHDRSRISISEKQYDITLSVTGIFIAEDHLFYRITLENDSNISYDIDQLRFFVRDRKVSRRTASQEIEIQPVSYWQRETKIPARSLKSLVVVLPKFTIPDQKNLYLQLTELSGGRHLQMKIKNTKAGKVVPLPTIKE